MLSYHYPPGPAVGGLRAAKVVVALREAGHEVVVITATLEGEAPGVRLAEPGLEVRTVRAWANPRFWYIGLKRKWQRTAAPAGGDGEEATPLSPDRVPAWKRYVTSFLWLPDDKQGFIVPALRAARGGRFDLLYTTVPPFSTHVAGLLLKWLTGIRWVAEFRDPWTDSHFRPAHMRSGASVAIERWLERSTLRKADLVVSVTEGIQRGLSVKLAERERGKLVVIRNGIETLRPEPYTRRPGQPYRIVHVGSFYHRRDPRPFLSALSSVATKYRLGEAELEVHLVGHCREFDGVSLNAVVRELGLAPLVHFRDWVPHAEAQRLVQTADLLLLLAQDQPDQVPNKLYDYLGAGVPILAFLDGGGESERMLQEVGGHFLVSRPEGAAVESALTTALGLSGEPEPTTKRAVLEQWTTARQMQQLMARIAAIS